MYIRDLAASIQRRWYIVLVGLALTVGLCLLTSRSIPVQYDADGSVLLLPPNSSVGPRGNPYLYLGGLGPTVDILVSRLGSDSVQREITAAHPDATVVIERDVSTTGPVILVTATSSRSEDALAATQDTLDVVPAVLADLQEQLSVPQPSLITSMQLTTVDSVTANDKGKMRAMLALAGVGTVGTLVGVGLLDGLLLSRRSRRGRPRKRNSGQAAGPPHGSSPTVRSEHGTPEQGPPSRRSREVSARR